MARILLYNALEGYLEREDVVLNFGFVLSLLLLQSPGSEFYVQEKYKVEFVLLDVAVVGKDGLPVTDLKASDFLVKEDKKEVDISFFETLDYGSSRAPDVSDLPEELKSQALNNIHQQIVIAIDLHRMNLFDANKVFDNLRQFISSMDTSQTYKINVYSMDRGSITKGFTTSLDAVSSAFDELQDRHRSALDRKRRSSGSSGLLLSDSGPAQFKSQGRSQLTDDFGFMDLEKAFIDCIEFNPPPNHVRCVNETLAHFMEVNQDRTNQIIGQLEILTYAFEESDGLKTMMFVSPGFGLDYMTSAVDLANAYKYGDKTAFIDAGIGKLNPDNDFRRIIHACIKNRVVFNTFDIFNADLSGRRTVSARNSRATSSIRRAYQMYTSDIQMGLRSLASESGGTFYQSARLKGVMNKSLEQSRFYYVLGYNSPPGSKSGKFRKIKIKVKRKGVKVRHRSGYFGA